jgi:hypothetical protein
VTNFIVTTSATTLTLDNSFNRLKLLYSPYLQTGFERILQTASGDIWMVHPTAKSGLTSIFFSKFNDVATMSWIPTVKCTEIHASDPNSIYTDYNIGTFGGDSVNSFSTILLNGGVYSHIAPITIPINGNTMTRVGTT